MFTDELLNLNIGYDMRVGNLKKMMDIVNAIDYINNAQPSREELINIVNYYGGI